MGHSRRWLPALVACVAITFLPAGLARAETEDEALLLDVVLAGPQERIQSARQFLDDLLASHGVNRTLTTVATIDPDAAISNRQEDGGILARVWIDLRREEQIVLFLVDQSWEQALVRQVVLADGLDVVALEQVGQIVVASVEALEAGRPLEMTPDRAARVLRDVDIHVAGDPGRESDRAEQAGQAEASTPESSEDDTAESDPWVTELPPPSVTVAAQPDVSLTIGAQYGLALWASTEAPLHGPGAVARVVFERASLRPTLALAVDYRLPSRVQRGSVEVGIQRLSLRLDLEVHIFQRGRVELAVVLGGGLDLSFVSPSLTDESGGLTAAAETVVAVPIVQAALSLGVRLTPRWALDIALGAHFDVKDLRYVTRDDGESEVFFDPWTVLPYLTIGARADLL